MELEEREGYGQWETQQQQGTTSFRGSIYLTLNLDTLKWTVDGVMLVKLPQNKQNMINTRQHKFSLLCFLIFIACSPMCSMWSALSLSFYTFTMKMVYFMDNQLHAAMSM